MKKNIRFIRFPICFSSACTVYNAQGSTFEAVSVGRMRSRGSQAESLYVAISRARSIDTVFLLENISDVDISHFSKGSSNELDTELERLRTIEFSTINQVCAAFPSNSKL